MLKEKQERIMYRNCDYSFSSKAFYNILIKILQDIMRYNEIVSQEEEIWRNIAIAKTNYCKTNLEELFIDLIIHGSYLL